jgi:hypothetical protein
MALTGHLIHECYRPGYKPHPGRLNGPRWRSSQRTTPLAASKHALRSLGRQWLELDGEIRQHDAQLDRLTKELAPTLREGLGSRQQLDANHRAAAGEELVEDERRSRRRPAATGDGSSKR